MANDWIKMRANLRTHPKVVRISSALKADRLRVVGGLHAVWCLFDEHSEDGQLTGYTPDIVDDLVGWHGFTEQLIAVGWVVMGADGDLSLPEFDTHNGASAKRRAQESERKRVEREASKTSPQDGRKTSAGDADKKRTREEKRREDRKNPPTPKGGAAGFDEFWSAYPKKVGKDAALKAFAKRNPDAAMVAQMVQALAWQRQREQWQREDGRFIPNPSTWLNQGRWEDGRPGDTSLWHETRSGVEQRGIELGIGPWMETEQYPAYKARVMAAAGAH